MKASLELIDIRKVYGKTLGVGPIPLLSMRVNLFLCWGLAAAARQQHCGALLDLCVPRRGIYEWMGSRPRLCLPTCGIWVSSFRTTHCFGT